MDLDHKSKVLKIICEYVGEFKDSPSGGKRKFPVDSLILHKKRMSKGKSEFIYDSLKSKFTFRCYICNKVRDTEKLFTCMKCYKHACHKCSMITTTTRCLECYLSHRKGVK